MLLAGMEDNMEMDMIQKNLAQDEVILELINLLKKNNMQDKANDLFETATYVEMLERRLDEMFNEITEVRKQLQEMQDKTFADTIKKSISDMVTKMENRCSEIKATLFEVKEDMKVKAKEIVQAVKWKGKEELNKISEFVGLKKKLMGIRDKVKEGIVDTNRIIAKIDVFDKGMREAGRMVANTIRTFADKPVVDYSEKEKYISKMEALKKPWELQKKVYQSMEIHLDAVINKVQKLSFDVHMHDMLQKWDDIYERNSKKVDKEKKNAPQPIGIQAVAEPTHNYVTEVKTINKGRSR